MAENDIDKGDITPAANVTSVLFACNINAVRSAMAEAMIKARFPGRIFTDSCGVEPGGQDGFAIAVMEEAGIDLSSHQPKGFDDLDCEFYDVIISFSPERMTVPSSLPATSTARPCTGRSTILPACRDRARSGFAPIVRCATISAPS